MDIPAGEPWVIITTSLGRMTFTLFAEEAPLVNNFLFLANEGYFDGVTFHRLIPGFMVQGGVRPERERGTRATRLKSSRRSGPTSAAGWRWPTRARLERSQDLARSRKTTNHRSTPWPRRRLKTGVISSAPAMDIPAGEPWVIITTSLGRVRARC